MINMLKLPMDKAHNTQEKTGNVIIHPKKEPKINPRDQKHCNRNEWLCWAY
jgi:hypothetical protein